MCSESRNLLVDLCLVRFCQSAARSSKILFQLETPKNKQSQTSTVSPPLTLQALPLRSLSKQLRLKARYTRLACFVLQPFYQTFARSSISSTKPLKFLRLGRFCWSESRHQIKPSFKDAIEGMFCQGRSGLSQQLGRSLFSSNQIGLLSDDVSG